MEVSGQLPALAAVLLKETAPGTHCIGGWLSPRAGLDIVDKRKISYPCQKWNPYSSAVQPIAYLLWSLSYPGSSRKFTLLKYSAASII
jgi:hypothetical protein